MREKGGQILKDLQQKLADADNGIESLNARIIGWTRHAEKDVHRELDRIKKRIKAARARVTAARADIRDWLQTQKEETSDTVASWKEQRDIAKLQDRADRAEGYAAAAFELVIVALAIFVPVTAPAAITGFGYDDPVKSPPAAPPGTTPVIVVLPAPVNRP